MAEAFVKLYKKMLDWEWYDDTNTKILFLHCLLKANWKSGSWHGIDYDPGQFITSLQSLADETHLTIQQVRTALEHLKSTGEITSKQQAKCRVITVNNWCQYQGDNKQVNKVSTRKQQDSNKEVTTDKEYKEREEEKELKNKRYYPNDAVLDKAFADYVDHRKRLKKPMSDLAIELAMEKLNKMSKGNNDIAVQILHQSIREGWQGLFELKDEPVKQQSSQSDWLTS